jgi:hypothetical protein
MRLTLTPAETRRWLQGDPDALAVEQAIMRWAHAEGIDEPIIVMLSTGRRAFGFRLPREPEEERR